MLFDYVIFSFVFGKDVFLTDDFGVLRQIYRVRITSEKKFTLQHHTASAEHLRTLHRKEARNKATARIFTFETIRKKKIVY